MKAADDLTLIYQSIYKGYLYNAIACSNTKFHAQLKIYKISIVLIVLSTICGLVSQ